MMAEKGTTESSYEDQDETERSSTIENEDFLIQEVVLGENEIPSAKLIVLRLREEFDRRSVYLDEDKSIVRFRHSDESKMKTMTQKFRRELRESKITITLRPIIQRIDKPKNSKNGVQFPLVVGFTIWVYEGEIRKLDVEGIVCPSNGLLQSYGKLEKTIIKSAGSKLKKARKAFIQTHGAIPKGLNCVTTAGNLPFKCVIHTNVPRWKDERNEDTCKEDLYHSVYLCLCKAAQEQLTSLALPALGAGKGGIPLEICCEQYARAVSEFRDWMEPTISLQEVHFCDLDSRRIQTIQKHFRLRFHDG